MADPDTVDRFVRRLEIALQGGHYALAHELVDQAERESTSAPAAIALGTLLTETPLPVRLTNALERHGIRSVGDALARTPAELRQLPRMGPDAVRQIVSTLRRLPIHAADGDE